nr:hypothetical protein [Tanacetum cinerariifolium]
YILNEKEVQKKTYAQCLISLRGVCLGGSRSRSSTSGVFKKIVQEILKNTVLHVYHFLFACRERCNQFTCDAILKGDWVKKGRTCSTNTHKSNSPRSVVHKIDRSPTRTNRPYVNSARPQTTQDLMIIFIQRVQRLERELKARTPIQKVDRGRSRSVMAWVPKKRVAPAEEFALLVKIILSQRCINVSQRHINNSQQLCDSYARMVPAAAKVKEHKCKEIAKPITPPSETASKEDNDPEQAQRDKDMQKNLVLIAKYFKRIYKPTNNNLRTSSNSRNKNVDTTPRYKIDAHSGQFGNQRTECRNPKRVKDSAYHKEKMLMCKQTEQGVPLQAKHNMAKIQDVPTAETGADSKPLEHVQNDAGYNVFANDLQHFEQSESVSNTCLVEMDDSNVILDSPDICEDDIQNDQMILIPDGEETLALERESRSKLNKDLVRPYDYTTLNSLYEKFKPPTQEYEIQLAYANEIRRKMWRKSFVKYKPNIYKNVGFLPVSKSISKIQQAYNVVTNNINYFKEIVDNAWIKHSKDQFRAPTAQDMEILIQTCLMPLAIKTQNDSFRFVHELKQEMHADLKVYYVKGLNHNLFSVGQFCDVDLEVAFRKSTCFVRDRQGNNLLTSNRGSNLYTISLQESTSLIPLCLMAKASPTQAWLWHRRLSHLNFNYINLLSKKDIVIGLPKLKYASFLNDKKASDYDKPDPIPQRQDVSSSIDANVPPQQESNLLFGYLYDEFFNACSNPQDKQPTTNIQPTSAPSTPTYVHAEENNDGQAEEEHLPDDEFTNPFSFLNGPLKEEVYVAQPDGFVDPDHPKKVYRLKKALYELKQAPRVWYDKLLKFLTSKGFTKGLQIHQYPRGIFINQAKYALKILHKHGMDKGQSIGTPMAMKPKLDADLSGNPVDQTDYHSKIRSFMYLTSSRLDIVQAKGPRFGLTAFSDADHAGCIDSRKSTSGGIQFLGDKLVSWMSKKQNCTAMSSTKAEYVALSASCAQAIWIRTQLQDYGFNHNKILLYCDSQSAIAISCNPVQHSRTKHIHTRYHFIKEHVENGIIELYFVRTEYQLADMFTKSLPEDRFKYLVRSGRIPVSAAKPKAAASTSAAKPVNTAGPKQSVNVSKSRSTFHKSHSPIRRSFYNVTSHSRRNSTERVNTTGSKAVSDVKGNRVIAVKTSVGNKAYLADYQEINDGGFVAFDSSRGKITGKGNQTDKNAGPQDTNGNAGTQDNVDAIKEVSDQHYMVLSLWSFISSTFKSSDDKAADDKPKDDMGSKNVEEPVNKEDQAYRDELDRLMIQEKGASDAADALTKEFEQGCMDQRRATKAGITNSFNIVIQSMGAEADFNNMESFTIISPIPTHRVHVDHLKDQILGDPKSSVQIKGTAKKSSGAHAFVSYIHKQRIDLPYGNKATGTKWVYRNKKDERGIIVMNKARMVAQGHKQEEGIYYDEVFAPVAGIKAIIIFLAFASFMGFIVYQIDVKRAFLCGTIEEEVYVSQPPCFIDPQFPNKVYVDDIIFRSTKKSLCDEFEALMHKRYQMSSMEELTFFLGIQVTQKLSHLHAVKRIFRYLKGQPKLGLWYPRDSPFNLESYSDSDYAGANLDRKSIT